MSKHKNKGKKSAPVTFVSSIPAAPTRTNHDEIAAALREHPGQWAEIMHGTAPSMHAQKVHLSGRSRPGRGRAYGAGFTFEVRSHGHGTGTATLYARFDPPLT